VLEIACFDPFVLKLCELPPHDIELHLNPAEDISKEPLPVFAFANLRTSILPLTPPGGKVAVGQGAARRNGASSRRLAAATISGISICSPL
jgi:hypothetical protein